jgi:hypothetical protein
MCVQAMEPHTRAAEWRTPLASKGPAWGLTQLAPLPWLLLTAPIEVLTPPASPFSLTDTDFHEIFGSRKTNALLNMILI